MNKVLVSIYVPLIEQEYDLFIPVNKKIGLVKKLIAKAIIELSDNNYRVNSSIKLSNRITNSVYDDNSFIINTDIRNGTKLILL